MKKNLLIALAVLMTLGVAAQKKTKQPPYTPAKKRVESHQQRLQMQQQSLVSNLEFKSTGPTIMSGRVVDLAVNPNDPTEFYAAYASGGLWHTTTNGISFNPVFDHEMVMTIGDIAVNWENNTIWIGTGENNSSRSSYSGVGMYKSTDGGNTWTHAGLEESHHIGRIVMHPTDPNTLWVAVLGHLYSPNKERGIYKTTDGGKTWQQTHFVNNNTGAIDLVIDTNNPNTLYAAMWHRERRAWNFVEAGEGSGIYKSTDGGNTWQLLTTAGSGFPTGDGVGRIGLTMSWGKTNSLYAIVDNQFRREKEAGQQSSDKKFKEELKTMSKADFLALEDRKINTYLKENAFPEKYNAKGVKKMVEKGKILPVALVDYTIDANSLLFDTPVIGAEVYRSDDGGATWKKTHKEPLDDLFYSYGYYFGQIRVAPHNRDKVYIVGVPILRSDDGGKTFKSINGENVHVDHHGLWVNPKKPGHLINGNDGGVNISYDDGETWFKANTPAVGQFYTVNVDMAKPYRVYGGLQDNGVWAGPSNYEHNRGWHDEGKYPYKRLLGGDGMQVEIDARDNNTVYTGYQFGHYFRVNQKSGEQTYIKPTHELGERPLRFNWQTPIHLSRHNQDILYFGSNKFHRSMNQGDDWETLSDDLTKGGRKGDVAYGTLTSITESPKKFGLLYVGSDDGLIHRSKDGGNTWQKLSDKLPQDMWVSRIVASAHDEATVYASLNGYRWDDFTPYLYVSTDYGTNWQRIGTSLPYEPINVVKEDPVNENILYIGTDHGIYVSLDKGQSFMTMDSKLPAAPVHDLVVHPRDHDLIVGTHGRSVFIANVHHLQQLNDKLMSKALHAFELDKITHSKRWGESWGKWYDAYQPNANIAFFAKKAGTTTIHIKTNEGTIINTLTNESEAGLNYFEYALTVDPSKVEAYAQDLNKSKEEQEEQVEKAADGNHYLLPGNYKVELVQGTEKVEVVLEVAAK